MARLISENAAGTGVDPSKATVSEFLDRWDRDWAACNVQGKTLERYRDLIARRPHPETAARTVERDLQQAAARRRQGWKPALAQHRRLRPSRAAPCPRPRRDLGCCSSKRGFGRQTTQAEPRRNQDFDRRSNPTLFLDHLNGRTLRADRFVLARHRLPPRRSSGAAMERYRLERLAGAHSERSVEQTNRSGVRFKSPKTKNSRRNIAISPWLLADLRAHRLRQQERRLALGLGKAQTIPWSSPSGMAPRGHRIGSRKSSG